MDQKLAKQLNDEINQIIRTRAEFFRRNYMPVREAYHNGYNWPEMDTLRHEISLSIIFGLCQGAITLTNHMLESLLKHSLSFHYTKHHPQPEKSGKIASLIKEFKEGLLRFRTQNLRKNIDSAFAAGLISEEEKIKLHEFRRDFRNAYGHADPTKTFRDQLVNAQPLGIKDDQITSGDSEPVSLADLPIAQGLMQAFQAQDDSIRYFLYMDRLTRNIRRILFDSPDPAS